MPQLPEFPTVTSNFRVFEWQANDSSMQLLGESQDEDRRLISELVVQRMHQFCRVPGTTSYQGVPGVPSQIPPAAPAAGSVAAPAATAPTTAPAPISSTTTPVSCGRCFVNL